MEMDYFTKDNRLKDELKTFLKFAFEQEYRMLRTFYPNHKLLVDLDLQAEQMEKVKEHS